MKKTNHYRLSGEAVLSNSLTRFRRMLKKALNTRLNPARILTPTNGSSPTSKLQISLAVRCAP